LSASGDTLQVRLDAVVDFHFNADPPAHIDYNGEAETYSAGYFVITGGSGAGELMGTAYGDTFAYFEGSGAREYYTSNFVYPGNKTYSDPMTPFKFTFGVPFELTIGDDMVFAGSTNFPTTQGYSDIEDYTTLNLTMHVFDAQGNAVPGAVITDVSPVPEVSSLALLITVSGIILARITRVRTS